jgi:nucleotide-binding universal stress UspA family protein
VLEEGVAQLKDRGYVVTGHLAVGEPVEEICRLASDIGADLIVVGHERRGIARWWHGSVGKMLLDHAPCSVFIAITRS